MAVSSCVILQLRKATIELGLGRIFGDFVGLPVSDSRSRAMKRSMLMESVSSLLVLMFMLVLQSWQLHFD